MDYEAGDAMFKNRKLLCFFVVLLVMVQGFPFTLSASVLPENKLYAKGAVLMDANSGRVLYAKGADDKMPMASTTKIMTCIIALERGNPEDVVTVSSYAASMPRVKLFMKAGEQYYLKDLLYSMMLESHNDSAVAVAEHIAGNTEAFAKLMNEYADKIGCKDTFFITPNGLDAEVIVSEDGKEITRAHETTAKELAKIMSYCITGSEKRNEFLSITQTRAYEFSNLCKMEGQYAPGTRTFKLQNKNALFDLMEGALSGKTGYTAKAGYCYVGALSSEGRVYVISLLACGWPNQKGKKWMDAKRLFEYGMSDFHEKSVKEALDRSLDDVLEEIYVKDGQTEVLGEKCYVDVSLDEQKVSDISEQKILMKDDEDIRVIFTKEESLNAPVAKGQTVGEISLLADGVVLYKLKLCTKEEILKIDYAYCLKKVMKYYCMKERTEKLQKS